MAKILPAGQHYGATLKSWSSGRLIVSRIRYAPDTKSDLHGNEHASVMFVEEGLCLKQMDGKLVELVAASGLFLPPGWLQQDSFSEPTTFLSAEFSSQFHGHLRELGSSSDRALPLSPAHSQTLRRHLRAELMNPDPYSPLVLEGLLMSTIASSERTGLRRNGRPPSWLLRAKEVIHEATSGSPSLDEIAHVAGVHAAHLSREFRRHFGSSPGEYARRIRVERAKTELTRSTHTLAHIALTNGFSDQAHFSRAFKRYTTLTPLEYRRLYKA